jgi:Cu+-exporting ATPase
MEDVMKSNKRMFALLLAAFITLAWLGFGQNADTAKDPVCGMSVKKDGAKYMYDYKGTTYYFCSEGCKTEFSKNPDKYLAKDAAASMGGMHGQMMGEKAGSAGCPFMSADVDKKIENTNDGVIITLSSKKAEMVKKLQDYAAMMKAGKCPMMESKGGAAQTEKECAGGCACKK